MWKKLRKPISLNLIFMKKSRRTKQKKKKEELDLLRHYNYRFIQEYQFSPSNSPDLNIVNNRGELEQKKQRWGFYSILLIMCACLGRFEGQLDIDPSMEGMAVFEAAVMGNNGEEVDLFDSGGEDLDWSVDERAERFIERFYERIN
ncbi:hypothetical protein Dimus_031126 [Dionaea muscipula]